jgi:hypothetical protein
MGWMASACTITGHGASMIYCLSLLSLALAQQLGQPCHSTPTGHPRIFAPPSRIKQQERSHTYSRKSRRGGGCPKTTGHWLPIPWAKWGVLRAGLHRVAQPHIWGLHLRLGNGPQIARSQPVCSPLPAIMGRLYPHIWGYTYLGATIYPKKGPQTTDKYY